MKKKSTSYTIPILRHFPVRSSYETGKPGYWRAYCGYESTVANEFTVTGKVTCVDCLEKIGARFTAKNNKG